MKIGTKLYSIFLQKCPRCHEGSLWKKSFFNSFFDLFKGEYNMHRHCNSCGQSFDLEPGFWWGAMYVSYALSSAQLLFTALICKLVFYLTLNQTMAVVLLVAFIFFAINGRLSRSIWINFFVSYDKNYKNENNNK
jgi:uncharacterized protein (DUF983 family)